MGDASQVGKCVSRLKRGLVVARSLGSRWGPYSVSVSDRGGRLVCSMGWGGRSVTVPWGGHIARTILYLWWTYTVRYRPVLGSSRESPPTSTPGDHVDY